LEVQTQVLHTTHSVILQNIIPPPNKATEVHFV